MQIAKPTPLGMFIRVDFAYSIRTHSYQDGKLLLVGGDGHTLMKAAIQSPITNT